MKATLLPPTSSLPSRRERASCQVSEDDKDVEREGEKEREEGRKNGAFGGSQTSSIFDVL